MNKPTHTLFGRLLYKQLKDEYGIHLDRESFLFGNILPDLCISFWTRPHFYENNAAFIKGKINKLLHEKQKSSNIGRRCSRDLGVLCHYYADFFCYTHNVHFQGDIKDHLKYERDLYHYLYDNYTVQSRTRLTVDERDDADMNVIFSRFNRQLQDYLHSVPSYETDIYYSMQSCLEALTLIAKSTVAEVSDDMDGQAALQPI